MAAATVSLMAPKVVAGSAELKVFGWAAHWASSWGSRTADWWAGGRAGSSVWLQGASMASLRECKWAVPWAGSWASKKGLLMVDTMAYWMGGREARGRAVSWAVSWAVLLVDQLGWQTAVQSGKTLGQSLGLLSAAKMVELLG